ncbi:MAG: hypothetical protein VYD90_12860 [Pseudomonadota bacterium]|nr:hypothetical protein [Pseudomonadota bacterium]
MTVLSPALDAELANDRVTLFTAIKLTVGEDTIRLLDGSMDLEIAGEAFGGEDPVYGVWESVDAFEDGTGDEAPGLMFTLGPADDGAALALSSPDMQGEAVQLYFGVMNETTGAVIGDPLLLFDGEVDMPKHEFGKEMLQVSLECVGGMERLFFEDEGIKLAPTFHQQVWPDEDGFNHVTGIQDNIYWGTNKPTSAV